jgi:hypothetical protein
VEEVVVIVIVTFLTSYITYTIVLIIVNLHRTLRVLACDNLLG